QEQGGRTREIAARALTAQRASGARGKPDRVDRGGDLIVACRGDRLADIERLEDAQVAGMSLAEVREREQCLGALSLAAWRPFIQRGTRRSHCCADFPLARGLKRREPFTGRGVMHLKLDV